MAGVLTSFGRTLPGQGAPLDPDRAVALLKAGDARPASLLGYGNGRSYGDTCLNGQGSLVDMRSAKRILAFDPASGVVEAEAGAMLADVIAHVAPHGFFPPVVPGTQFVTLGGAVANDVHGKNHHLRGTFGNHVESLVLLRSDGQTQQCSRSENTGLFAATIGGMGLTGLILSVRLRLMRVASLDVDQKVRPFRDLGEYFALAEEADAGNEYAVAWIDQLAGGARAGRGLLLTGNHAFHGARTADRAGARLRVPAQPPFTVLNRPFLSVFNAAYRWKTARAQGRVGYRGFFFPLDAVRDWNRLYGPRGLHQHQSAIPFETAAEAVPALLAATRKAGQGSFLTVLKRFGAVASPGVLSFPRPGYTLTLDLPDRGPATHGLLDTLDRIAIDAGGAVNPYKDARMSAAVFAASFPRWAELEAMRDPAFLSDFWSRTALTLPRATAIAAE